MIEISDQPQKVERAFLVGVQNGREDANQVAYLLDELAELVRNMGVKVVARQIVKIKEPKAKFLLGSGQTEELIRQAKGLQCDCIIFDVPLTPGQQRNWEKTSRLCVIDRQEVILDIFADRAQTKEAVLQVELARMEYSLPRLKNAWTHLSRQRGGSATQRGEGEAQIELDQRIVRQRIARLKKELFEVKQHRAIQRKQRQRVPLPTAALVGYTNAGKSSLLNRLTGSGVLVENKLFATLDPTTRQLTLPRGQKILLTDTVGFVRRLPHGLVEAFKATLEEAVMSDYIIHLLDASNPEVEAHRETTLGVLKELGAVDKPILTVYNKVDRLAQMPGEEITWLTNSTGDRAPIRVSALTGEGLEKLMESLEMLVTEALDVMELFIPHHRYDIVGKLYANGCVKREESLDEGVRLTANIPDRLRALVEPYSTVNSN